MSDQSAQEALAQEKAELAALAGKPLGSKLGTYLKKCGPGYLQSAITLGGGSLSSSLFLGVLAGFSMMWLQPLAMIMGVIMLCAISYVTLSTEKRPFRLINNHISPVLGWGWLIATLLANFVWCLPQYALGAAAIQESMFPDLRTSTTATVVICVCLLAVATTVIAFYDSGNKGIRIFEIVLKGMVALIVLCFFGVVGALAFSDQGLPIGKILSGLVPRFGLLNSPAPEYLPIIEQTGAFGAFWTAKIVDQQRDVMIAAFATAVGINMTFLLPYSMLKKGWGKEHRGLAIFDLSTSLFLPFVLATGCVVIASASQFHATDKIPSPPSKDFVKNVDARLAEEHAGFGALPDAEKQALRDALPLADQQMALAMVKRDAWSLSKALEPLAGSVASKWIFGIGVLGMALSTIIILMLISGFTICEMFNIPPRGIAHFLGCFVTGVIGAFRSIRLERRGEALPRDPDLGLRSRPPADRLLYVPPAHEFQVRPRRASPGRRAPPPLERPHGRRPSASRASARSGGCSGSRPFSSRAFRFRSRPSDSPCSASWSSGQSSIWRSMGKPAAPAPKRGSPTSGSFLDKSLCQGAIQLRPSPAHRRFPAAEIVLVFRNRIPSLPAIMKKKPYLMFAAPLLALALAPFFSNAQDAESAEDYRDFTGTNGTKISAILLEKTEDTAKLKMKNGRIASIAIDNLVEDDQKYIREWDQDKSLFLSKCRDLTVHELLTLRGYESFDFRIEGNHIFVDGAVNGKKARFMIDTGAGGTTFHVDYAKEVGCEVGPMDQIIRGIGGEAPAAITKVKEITLGESKILDQTLLSCDMFKDIPNPTKNYDAIFGADFLRQLHAVISYKEYRIFFRPDYANGAEERVGDEVDQFRLFKMNDGRSFKGLVKSKTPSAVTIASIEGKEQVFPLGRFSKEDQDYVKEWTEGRDVFLRKCKELTVQDLLELRKYQSFEYEIEGNHIFVDGKLNEKDMRFMIDTGAGSSVLNADDAKATGCEVGPMNQTIYGIGGEAKAAVTKVPSLEMGHAKVTNRRLLSTDLFKQVGGEGNYGGIFGADFLRELNGVVNYRENRIFLRQD
ncbi:MAG: aspartyl protease family protein [Verrucomicrobiales bacterium]